MNAIHFFFFFLQEVLFFGHGNSNQFVKEKVGFSGRKIVHVNYYFYHITGPKTFGPPYSQFVNKAALSYPFLLLYVNMLEVSLHFYLHQLSSSSRSSSWIPSDDLFFLSSFIQDLSLGIIFLKKKSDHKNRQCCNSYFEIVI